MVSPTSLGALGGGSAGERIVAAAATGGGVDGGLGGGGDGHGLLGRGGGMGCVRVPPPQPQQICKGSSLCHLYTLHAMLEPGTSKYEQSLYPIAQLPVVRYTRCHLSSVSKMGE